MIQLYLKPENRYIDRRDELRAWSIDSVRLGPTFLQAFFPPTSSLWELLKVNKC